MSVFYKLSKEQKALAKYLRENPIEGARVSDRGAFYRDSKALSIKLKNKSGEK